MERDEKYENDIKTMVNRLRYRGIVVIENSGCLSFYCSNHSTQLGTLSVDGMPRAKVKSILLTMLGVASSARLDQLYKLELDNLISKESVYG